MKNKVIGSMFVLTILFTATSFAQQSPKQRKHEPKQEQFGVNGKANFAHEKLLTDEQKEAWKEIRMESMKKAKPFRDELREVRAHYQTLMTAEKPNMSEIYVSIEKQGKLQIELSKIRAESRIRMQSLLTGEQKLKIEQMKAHHKMKAQRHSWQDQLMDDQI